VEVVKVLLDKGFNLEAKTKVSLTVPFPSLPQPPYTDYHTFI
jgi:hypothetical protein